MRKKHGTHLKGVLDGLIGKLEKKTAAKGNYVLEAWDKASGKKGRENSRPVSFKKGVLVVVVENSSWLYKLTLEKETLIKKFNDEYKGRTKAKDVRFRIGTFGE